MNVINVNKSIESEFGLTKNMIIKIMKELSQKIRKANDEVFKSYEIQLSNKNLSEIIGKITEKTAAEYLSRELGYKVNNAKADSEPDLMFTKIRKAVEIKVTSTNSGWTGGEFSRRPFDYILISWGGNFDEFFVAFVHLEKKDWTSNMSKNFYGPSYSAKSLYYKKDKTIFLGSLEMSPKGAVKLRRENITSQKRLKV